MLDVCRVTCSVGNATGPQDWLQFGATTRAGGQRAPCYQYIYTHSLQLKLLLLNSRLDGTSRESDFPENHPSSLERFYTVGCEYYLQHP